LVGLAAFTEVGEVHMNAKKLFTLLDLCVSSLRRGHANLLCIVPILTDDPRRESKQTFSKDRRQANQNTTRLTRQKARSERTGLWYPAANVTVAILAQGTSWAVAVTQAFLLPGSILRKRALRNNVRQSKLRCKARQGVGTHQFHCLF
jgi:hypothetical protein